jgi:AcrR family transcriptional regulator
MARTRSVRAHADVLTAALHLFAERGIDATSVDAIAEASRVSKATIYKHWPDKDALCLEVMMWVHGRSGPAAPIETGDLRTDLLSILHHQPPEQHAEARSRLMPHLMAYGVRNPAFGKAWRTRVLEPPRTELTTILERAIARGALPRGLSIDVAIAQLFGPMMYAHVLTLIDREPPADIREVIVDAFVRSYGQRPQTTRPRKPQKTQTTQTTQTTQKPQTTQRTRTSYGQRRKRR